VNRWQLILSLVFFVPTALLGGLATFHTGVHVYLGMAMGGLVGVAYGLLYGGAHGKELDYLIPELGDGDEPPGADD
jgi:hypothetical protein